MVQIHLKRAYEPESAEDGFRILIDKLWPRGIKKVNLHYDLWAKDIAPSTALRVWFHEDEINHWKEFCTKYTEELAHSDALVQLINEIKDKDVVTLLFGSKNAIENHAIILKEFMDKKLMEGERK